MQGIIWGNSEPNDEDTWTSEFDSESREALEDISD